MDTKCYPEVEEKIKSGIYKVESKLNGRSPIWELFLSIYNEHGSLFSQLVQCKKCKKVLEHIPADIRNLNTHFCFLNYLSNEFDTIGVMKRKIHNGDFKLQLNNEREDNLVRKRFARILNEVGDMLPEYFHCTECKDILKTDNGSITKLIEHSCFKQSDLYKLTFLPMSSIYTSKKRKRLGSQTKFDNTTKTAISQKIQEGIYKLNLKQNKKSLMWKIFAFIEKDDGNIIDGYACCTKCKKILKIGHMNLQLHKCYRESYPRKTDTQKETTAVQKIVEENISSGIYKLKNNDSSTSDLWKSFALISKDDGSIINDKVFCRECKMVLNYDKQNDDNLALHKAGSNGLCRSSEASTSKLDIKIYKNEILNNIEKGIYKLKMREDRPSAVWKIFAMIEKEDGSLLKGYVACTKCKYVVEHNRDTQCRLNGHKCFRKMNENEILVERQDLSSFENISFGDGSTLDGFVCCRQCNMLLKYDGTAKIVLEPHTCFSATSTLDPEFIDEFEDLPMSPVTKQTDSNSVLQCVVNEPVQTAQDDVAKSKFSNEFNNIQSYNLAALNNLCNESQPINNIKKQINISLRADSETFFSTADKEETFSIYAQWTIEDVVPPSEIEGSSFRNLIRYWLQRGAKYGETLGIEDSIIDSMNLSQHIQEVTEEKRMQVKCNIKEISNKACISIYFWTDNMVKRNFFSATLHFYKNNELYDMFLGVKSLDILQTTKETIRNKLHILLEGFGLGNFNDLVFITDTDNLIEKLEDCIHLKCSRYMFEMVLNSAIKDTSELVDIIKTCTIINNLFKSSTGQSSTELNADSLCKSPYGLFKSITNNWNEVNEFMNDNKESLRISDATVFNLQSLVKLCQKFEFIFKRIQELRFPSLCFVIPSIERLKVLSEATTTDPPEIKALKNNLLKYLNEIWLTNISTWHKAAWFLYPPANEEQENHLKEVKDFCIKQMKALPQIYENNNTTENGDSILKDTVEIDFFFPNLRLSSNNAEEEIKRYCREKIAINRNFNVLQWWQNNSIKYPLLSQIALQILSVPASINDSNRRILSVSNDHQGFTAKTVDNIVFLNSINQNEF